MRLEGQTAIVTGAKQGLGKATAEAFAKEGANLSLNIYQQDEKEIDDFKSYLENNYGVKVIVTEGDISDEDTVKTLTDQTIQEFKAIDILVNAAGINNQALVKDIDTSNWDKMMNVNLRSVFLTTKHCIPYMEKQESGRIINFASQIGQKGEAGNAHYAASKAGIIAFTKSLAQELGEYGITANCVAPGPIDTQMTEMYTGEFRREKEEALVIPRFGKIEEVIPSVLFLASSPDGDIYTGQTLGPNSGDVML